MNPFKPSKKRQPAVFGADPRFYHKIGTKEETTRGNPQFILSRSELAEFAVCPERWIKSEPQKMTPAMAWGSLLDCIVLTPDLFEKIYSVTPDQYKSEKDGMKDWNWNAKVCKEWRENEIASGKEVVKWEDALLAWTCAKRLNEDPIVKRFLELCRKQVQIFVEYTDPDTGITLELKAMIDLAPPVGGEFGDCIGDYKTTNSATPRDWQKTVAAQGYHYQAAMYLDAWNAANDTDFRQFVHVVQESEAPFQTARRLLSQEFLTVGRIAYRRDLAAYCRCLERKRWPGYDDMDSLYDQPPIMEGWRLTEPPAWMLREL